MTATFTPTEPDALIEAHLDLVEHIVHQVAVHFPRHIDRSELSLAGREGLVDAARRFDPARGVPFNRFASTRIRGAILDAIRAADWAPRSVRRAARQLEELEQSLASELGRSPDESELAAALGVTTTQVAQVRGNVARSSVLTLDAAVGEDSEELLLTDLIATASDTVEEGLEYQELLGYLRDAVALLPDRQRRLIEGYFFEGRTSEELAAEFGVTLSRISQLRTDALGRLRDCLARQFGTEPTAGAISPRAARQRDAYARAVSENRSWRERLAVAGA